MRFPETNIMTRVFHLFRSVYLNSDGIKLEDKMIQYKFADSPKQREPPKGNTFRLFNGIRFRAKDLPKDGDPFLFGRARGGDVHQDYIDIGASKLFSDAVKPFADAILSDMANHPQHDSKCEAGFRNLMRFDQYSTRGYLSDCKKIEPTAISWMETMTFSTGWFDRALSETVFETLCFGSNGPLDINWYCLE